MSHTRPQNMFALLNIDNQKIKSIEYKYLSIVDILQDNGGQC